MQTSGLTGGKMNQILRFVLAAALAVLLAGCGLLAQSGSGKHYRAGAMFVCRPAEARAELIWPV